MTKYAELIARLEAAEVGSDDLTIDVLEAAGETWSRLAYYQVSKSLDAALALAERVIAWGHPAIWCEDMFEDGTCVWAADVNDRTCYSKTPATALCAAILKALEAKQ